MIEALQQFAAMPWAMRPQSLHALALSVAHRMHRGDGETSSPMVIQKSDEIAAAGGSVASTGAVGRHGLARRDGNIATVTIGGMILGSDPWWAKYDPAAFTNTATLTQTLAELRADNTVKGVVLLIDSPGGSVAGVAEAHSAVAALAASKPTVAHASNLIASAAYWVGAAATSLSVGRAAAVGSIGVYTVVYDFSQWLSKIGITAHLVKAGRDKAAGQGDVPVTADQLAVIQREIDGLYAVFTADVARSRRMNAEQISQVATGEVFVGASAVKLGLADKVADVSEVRAEVGSRIRASQTRAVGSSNAQGADGADGDAIKQVSPERAAANRSSTGSDAMKSKMASVISAGILAGIAAGAMTPTGAGTVAAPRDSRFGRTQHVPDADGQGGGGGDGGASATIDTDKIASDVIARIGTQISVAVSEGAQKAVASILEQQNKAKADRAAKIRAAGALAGNNPGVKALVDACIADESLTVDAAKDKIIEATAKAMAPIGGGQIEIGAEGKDKLQATLGLSLTDRILGQTTMDAIASGGEKTLAAVQKLGFADHAGLRKALAETRASDLRRAKLTKVVGLASSTPGLGFSDDSDRIMATLGSHQTSDFPNLLAGVIQKSVLASMTLIPTTFEKWCSIGDHNDFRPSTLVEVGPGGELREVAPGGTLQEGSVDDRGTTARVKTFGRLLSISRNMIVDDDVNAISRIIQAWAASARLTPEFLALRLLKSGASTIFPGTNANFFSGTHGNLLSGSALNMTNLDASFSKLRTAKWTPGSNTPNPANNMGGQFLQQQVGLVLAGEARRSKLKQLQLSERDPDNVNTAVNLVRDSFQYEVSQILDTKADGTSATDGWFVIAAQTSGRAPVRVSFLQGRREPIFNPISNGSIMGVNYEVVFDCNASFETPEAAVFNPGSL